MMNLLQTSIIGVVAAVGLTGAALAQDIPAPTGAAILTVSGDIAVTNQADTLALDADTLASLGNQVVETSTIWTEGVISFEGVPLATLMEAVGATDGMLRASAINDYTVEIPVSDAVTDGPIIAYRMNGKEMSVRDKGPLWIIYPYDQNPAYQSETTYSRSIWQLDRIEVVQ